MKQKLLSLVALAGAMFMSTSVWAQWEEPSMPELEKKNVDAVEAGKSYFIMNVGAGQFITGANDWSTKISLTRDGVASEFEVSPALAIYVADSTQTFSGSTCSGVSMRLDGKYTVYGASGARTFTNTYLFRDSEEWGFMDHGSQEKGYIWKITKAENGYYRIQTAEGDPTYPDAATQFAGWDCTNGPIAIDEYGELVIDDETGLEPNTAVLFNCPEDDDQYIIDWMFIDAATYLTQLAAYDARVKLYELLLESESYDVNTDAATAVYNNPNATKADLEAAFAALKADINRAYFLSIFEGASEEDPLDVTEYAIENPNFDSSIDGWTITVVGQNLQWQNRKDGQVDEEQNWVQIDKFIEAWRQAPTALGDGAISQTIYGLPQGKYVLECDAMACLQGGSPNSEDAVENAFIFIQGDNSEVRTPIKSPDTQPKHWTVTFICPEGNNAITFGLKVENTTANWISADNFQLWYYGEFEGTPEQAELQTSISKAMASVEKIESGIYMANNEVIAAFEAALASAQNVAASRTTAEDYLAAKADLEAAQAAYEASVKAYEKLGTFIGADGSASKLDEYMETASQLGDLYDILEPWQQELNDGYYDGTISTERIEELMGGFLTKIREYIKMGSIEPGADITILLDNPDFSEGTTSNVTGWTINSGSIGELAKACGNIETWHKTFDISQTITDMPAGIYDITVQGFVRHDTPTDTENTYFYAGDTKTCLMTLEDQWSLDPIYTSDGPNPYLHDGNYDATMTTPEGETGYKCNGMGGAYYWFQTEIPADLYETFKYKAPAGQDWSGDYYYTNHIKVVLKQPGDFTIGLGTTSGTDWIIWDNFKIKYIGEDLDVYSEMVLEEFAKLQEAYDVDPDDKFVTKEGEDLYAAVAQKVDDVKNIENGDDALALIEEIGQVLAYINAGNKEGATLRSTYYLYAETMMELVESSDETFPALLSQIEDQLADPSQIADNDAIQTIIASLKKGWTKYVMADVINEASAENPQDVTAAIYNPDYKNYDLSVDEPTNATGWTNEGSNGSTVFNGTYYEEIEFYNTNFNHYQTIEGLQPGWYIISNDAFYRAGDVNAMTTAYNDSVPAINSYMYAVVAGDTVTTAKLHSMFDGAQVEATGSDGEVTVNLNGEEGVETLYVPNLMGSALAFLTLEDYETGEKFYTNTIAAEVKEDGVLTIGVRKNDLITNDWTVITNWTLQYTGAEKPNLPEPVDPLASVQNLQQSVKVAQFFGIDGRQQTRLQRGINIVRMADGSVQKVLVK